MGSQEISDLLDSVDAVVGVGAGSLAIILIVGMFTNLLQNTLQLVGVGAAINLIITAIKIVWYDRRENKKRVVRESIQRLQPKIYDPLLRWATRSMKALHEQIPDEIYNRVPAAPELDGEGDFIAISGERLRKRVAKTLEIQAKFHELWLVIGEEWRSRLQSLIDASGLGGALNNIHLRLDGEEMDVAGIPFNMSIRFARERIKSSRLFRLRNTAQTGSDIECPKEVLEAIQDTANLPSSNAFRASMNEFRNQLDSLISELAEDIRNGEPDWRI